MALSDITNAANDYDLKTRFVAAAAEAGVNNPQFWVEQNIYKLVTESVGEGQNISDVYAYAVATMPPTPGSNPSAVTDAYIRSAVGSVASPEE